MKKNRYFSHDYGARNDPDLVRLSIEMGLEGIGIYWGIIEMLHEYGGYIELNDARTIAYNLHVEEEKVRRVFNSEGLFVEENGQFYSRRVLENLRQMNIVSAERAKAGKKGAAVLKARLNADAKTAIGDQLSSRLPEQGQAFAEQLQEKLPDQMPREATTIDEQINKEINKENKKTYLSKELDEMERERILEIFVFERGWDIKSAERELKRFEDYYIPSRWKRRGDINPVEDRVALSRSWSSSKTEPPIKLFPDKDILSWISKTYREALRCKDTDAYHILHGIQKIEAKKGEKKPQRYELYCKEPVLHCLERYLSGPYNFEVRYWIIDKK